MVEWRKICSEYSKRTPTSLPHMIDFLKAIDQALTSIPNHPRSQKIRAEKPGIGQTTLWCSMRKYHMSPIDLPPLPTVTAAQCC